MKLHIPSKLLAALLACVMHSSFASTVVTLPDNATDAQIEAAKDQLATTTLTWLHQQDPETYGDESAYNLVEVSDDANISDEVDDNIITKYLINEETKELTPVLFAIEYKEDVLALPTGSDTSVYVLVEYTDGYPSNDFVITSYEQADNSLNLFFIGTNLEIPEVMGAGDTTYYFKWSENADYLISVLSASADDYDFAIAADAASSASSSVIIAGEESVSSLSSHYIGFSCSAITVDYEGSIGAITGNFISNAAISSSDVVNGGAINNAGTIGTITSYFVANSVSADYYASGGAIQNFGSIGSITGHFIANSSSANDLSYGGAITNYGSIVSITGDFIANMTSASAVAAEFSVGAFGGAIYNCSSLGTISGDFIANSANASGIVSAYGGAIYNTGGTIDSIIGDFIENATYSNTISRGAAIYNCNEIYSGVTGTINTIIGDFIGNVSNTYTNDEVGEFKASGAAIYNEAFINIITGDFISNNVFTYSSNLNNDFEAAGGAIYNEAFINIITGDFIANSACSYYSDSTTDKYDSLYAKGGAVYNAEDGIISSIVGDFIINSVSNYGYTSSSYGGAIYNEGTITSITGDFIANCAAADSSAGGGAIYNYEGAIGSIVGDFISNSCFSGTTTSLVSMISYHGGAISTVMSTIDSIIGDFTNNYTCSTLATSYASGGAIMNNMGTIGEICGDFTGNYSSSTANALGGAISNSSASIGTITGDFISNFSLSSEGAVLGGAIYNNFGSSIGSIEGDFIGNYASALGVYGGAIYNGSDEITTLIGDFIGNYASASTSAYGGAICNSATINTITGDFIDNYSTSGYSSRGGSIYTTSTIETITGDFSGNSTYYYFSSTSPEADDDSGSYGGAIYNSGAINTITGDFTDNYAEAGTFDTDVATPAYGGAIYVDLGSSIETITGDFSGNYTSATARAYGGAIYIDDANYVVSTDFGVVGAITGDFIGNYTSSGYNATGGAIYNGGDIETIVGDFIDNSSNCYCTDDSYEYYGVFGYVFYSNAGAIYNGGDIETIVGDFIGNFCSLDSSRNDTSDTSNYYYLHGGALFNSSYSTIEEITGDFIENYLTCSVSGSSSGSAVVFGGAIYNGSGATIEIITGDFIGNYCLLDGGAFGGTINNIGVITTLVGDFTGNYISCGDFSMGGAIYSTGTISSITGDFTGNYISSVDYSVGGAIYSTGTISSITGDFTGNYISCVDFSAGGAIYSTGTISSITGDFIDNYSTSGDSSSGGAIYTTSTIETITGDFSGNSTYYYFSSTSPEADDDSGSYGGAIYNSGAINTITGDFTDNYAAADTFDTDVAAPAYGGAIYVDLGASIETITADFSGNYTSATAGSYGGAIYIAYTNDTTTTDLGVVGATTGDFIGNYTSSSFSAAGGAIYNGGDIETIVGDFIDNSSNCYCTDDSYEYYGSFGYTFYSTGGAIYNIGDIETIEGDFIGNSSSLDPARSDTSDYYLFLGGAIYNSAFSTIEEITGDFIENYLTCSVSGSSSGSAVGQGGAIYNGSGATIEIITGDFSGNYILCYGNSLCNASSTGGAVFNHGTINSIIGDFTGNYISCDGDSYGGAINSFGTINSIIGDFTGNYILSDGYSYGGAICNMGTISSITGDFIGNTASSESADSCGGAIYNSSSLTLLAEGVSILFNDNEADLGEAIYNTGTTYLNAYEGYEIVFNDSIYNTGEIIIGSTESTDYSGSVILNAELGGTSDGMITLASGTLVFSQYTDADESTSYGNITQNALVITGGEISTLDGEIRETSLGLLTLSADTTCWSFDIDLSSQTADTLISSGLGEASTGSFLIDEINVLGSTNEESLSFTLTEDAYLLNLISTDMSQSSFLLNGEAAEGFSAVSYNQTTGVLSITVEGSTDLQDMVSSVDTEKQYKLSSNEIVTESLGELAGTSLSIFGESHSITAIGTDVAGITISGASQILTITDVSTWSGFTGNAITNEAGTLIIKAVDSNSTWENSISNDAIMNVSAASGTTVSFNAALTGSGTLTLSGNIVFNDSLTQDKTMMSEGQLSLNSAVSGDVELTGVSLSLGADASFTSGSLSLTDTDLTLSAAGISLDSLVINTGNTLLVDGLADYVEGSYTLLVATGSITGDLSNLVLDTTSLSDEWSYELSIENDSILLTIEAALQAEGAVYWNNATGEWTAESAWVNADGKEVLYEDGADVTFKGGSITLNETVAPGSLAVSGEDDTTISGTGSIAGETSLSKTGSATLTLSTANSYSGGTSLVAGTLILGDVCAAGTGSIKLSGGTLDLSSLALANDIEVAGDTCINNGEAYAGTLTMTSGSLSGAVLLSQDLQASSGTITAALSGTAGVQKTGSGTVTLSGDLSYTGATSVTEGTLIVQGSCASSGYSVSEGASLSLVDSSLNLSDSSILGSLSLSNSSLILDGDSLSLGSLDIGSDNTLVLIDLADYAVGSYTLLSTGGITGDLSDLLIDTTDASMMLSYKLSTDDSNALVMTVTEVNNIETEDLSLEGDNTFDSVTVSGEIYSEGTLSVSADSSAGSLEGGGSLQITGSETQFTISSNTVLSGLDNDGTLNVGDESLTLTDSTDNGGTVIAGALDLSSDKGNSYEFESVTVSGELSVDGTLLISNSSTVGSLDTDATSVISGEIVVNGEETSKLYGTYDDATISFESSTSALIYVADASGLDLNASAAEITLIGASGGEISNITMSDNSTLNLGTIQGTASLNVTGESVINASTLAFTVSDTMIASGSTTAVIASSSLEFVGATLAIGSTGTSFDISSLTSMTSIALFTVLDSSLSYEGSLQNSISTASEESVEVELTSGSIAKYFTNASYVDGVLYADVNTNSYGSLANSSNGAAGLSLMSQALIEINPQYGDNADEYKDMASALNGLDTYNALGQNAAADKLGAAIAGAGVTALGSAAMADIDRQLRSIRNRSKNAGLANTTLLNSSLGAWVSAEGSAQNLSNDGTAAGHDLTSVGGSVGVEAKVGGSWRLGAAYSFVYGDVSADAADYADGELTNNYISFYANKRTDRWSHNFVAMLGLIDASLDRTVTTSSAGDFYKTSGDTSGTSFALSYELGYSYHLDEDAASTIQPLVSLSYTNSAIDGYTEDRSSDAALVVGDQENDYLTIGIGVQYDTIIGASMYNRESLLTARFVTKIDAGDRMVESDVSLQQSNAAAQVIHGAEPGAVGVELGLGLDVPVSESSSIFADVSCEFRSGMTDVSGGVGYRFSF